MEKDRYLLSSLNNALCLLDLLSHASSLSLAELTHLSGMDKASVFRSLYTLEKNGYVQKLPEARYRLGMKFLYYGNLVAAQQDIVTAARPALQNLTLRCKLAVHLSCLNQDYFIRWDAGYIFDNSVINSFHKKHKKLLISLLVSPCKWLKRQMTRIVGGTLPTLLDTALRKSTFTSQLNGSTPRHSNRYRAFPRPFSQWCVRHCQTPG